MYHKVGDRLIWVSVHSPRWKDWRGRLLYKHRYTVRQRASDQR